MAPVVMSTIAAQSLAFTEVSFDGVASLRTAQGRVPMLKFSMNSMTFAGGATLTVKRHKVSVVTTGPSFGFAGHVVLYTTKLSGELNGVKVTFTPKSPPLHLHPQPAVHRRGPQSALCDLGLPAGHWPDNRGHLSAGHRHLSGKR